MPSSNQLPERFKVLSHKILLCNKKHNHVRYDKASSEEH